MLWINLFLILKKHLSPLSLNKLLAPTSDVQVVIPSNIPSLIFKGPIDLGLT